MQNPPLLSSMSSLFPAVENDDDDDNDDVGSENDDGDRSHNACCSSSVVKARQQHTHVAGCRLSDSGELAALRPPASAAANPPRLSRRPFPPSQPSVATHRHPH